MKIREECPACKTDNKKNKGVFSRDFSLCRELVPFQRYHVFQCKVCGLIYAGDIEESMPLEVYYQEMSRYEGENFVLSPKLQKHYALIAKVLSKHVNKDARILDIGCAFGGLLNEFKKLGYSNICGLEPSLKNCLYAMENYKINVMEGLLGEKEIIFKDEKFDLIILSGVLEHLIDIQSSIRDCKKLLSRGGLLAIIVPDIAMFAEHYDLYQEFSIEHINYFGIDSLYYIMGNEGFTKDIYVQDHESLMGLAGNMITVWRNEDICQCLSYIQSQSSGECLKDYIMNCERLKGSISKKMKKCNLESGYYIWGVGTNTAILIQLGIFSCDKIQGIFDSNPNYVGKSAYGQKIRLPKELKKMDPYPIIISSQYAFDAIKRAKEAMGLQNEIIDLFCEK